MIDITTFTNAELNAIAVNLTKALITAKRAGNIALWKELFGYKAVVDVERNDRRKGGVHNPNNYIID